MMIYLSAEVISGLGEDTFWTWFKREFPSSSFETPKELNDTDIVLRYSTLGFLTIPGKQVALCWELYPEMKNIYETNQWDSVLERIYQTAKYSTYRVVPTQLSKQYYDNYGSVDILPIGVDTNIFKPLNNKKNIRSKYGLPTKSKIAIWVGTTHPMKGMQKLLEYYAINPNLKLITIWKSENESWNIPGAYKYVGVDQKTLNELFNAADIFISTNMLSTYFMVEWEAMSTNIPMLSIGSKKEFLFSANPRSDIIKMGWSREEAKKKWSMYLKARGIEW